MALKKMVKRNGFVERKGSSKQVYSSSFYFLERKDFRFVLRKSLLALRHASAWLAELVFCLLWFSLGVMAVRGRSWRQLLRDNDTEHMSWQETTSPHTWDGIALVRADSLLKGTL